MAANSGPQRSVILADGSRAKKWSLAGLNRNHELNPPLYPSPPMMTLFTGPNGHCKTLSMVNYLAACHGRGFRVVSTPNFGLKFGDTFDYRRFLNNEYQGCVIGIDELEEYADALRYQSDDALDFVGVLIQMRHEQNEIVATTQFPGEVLSRLRRRINYEVQCFDPGWGNPKTAGRHIYQRWKSNPFNDMAGQSLTRRQLHIGDEMWPLYDTHAHIRVGAIRRSSKQRKAAEELTERNMVWSAMWGAVIRNNRPWTLDGVEHPTVASGEVQVALNTNEPPMMLSVKKIGQYLGELGAEQYRESPNVRRWIIPRRLFAEAPQAGNDKPEPELIGAAD